MPIPSAIVASEHDKLRGGADISQSNPNQERRFACISSGTFRLAISLSPLLFLASARAKQASKAGPAGEAQPKRDLNEGCVSCAH